MDTSISAGPLVASQADRSAIGEAHSFGYVCLAPGLVTARSPPAGQASSSPWSCSPPAPAASALAVPLIGSERAAQSLYDPGHGGPDRPCERCGWLARRRRRRSSATPPCTAPAVLVSRVLPEGHLASDAVGDRWLRPADCQRSRDIRSPAGREGDRVGGQGNDS